MRRTIRVVGATALLLTSLAAPTVAQAPGPAVTVATVEWIEQFDPGVPLIVKSRPLSGFTRDALNLHATQP